jgi:16S rRNA (adenine1518-N6/adenine1519-N6)-dimethyltransferase
LPQKLGQHFLVSGAILERLATAACGEHTQRVIELGPGRGALTAHLLPRTEELHAVELDRSLVSYLQRHFGNSTALHIHHSDILQTDLSQWGPAVVTGNLPYYITSPIIERFLRLDERFPSAVFLMQREVAERILAPPGTRDYGFLSVSTRLVCDVSLVCHVPPAAFSPPPKVDSTAIRLLRRPAPQQDLEPLLQFVGRCFAHKRKNLRNNLRPYYGAALDGTSEANLRAEQLSLDAFIQLFSRLEQIRHNLPSL